MRWARYCHAAADSLTIAGYQAGAISITGTAQIALNQTVLSGNSGQQGGALCAKGCISMSITSSTFAANNATDGGALFLGQ